MATLYHKSKLDDKVRNIRVKSHTVRSIAHHLDNFDLFHCFIEDGDHALNLGTIAVGQKKRSYSYYKHCKLRSGVPQGRIYTPTLKEKGESCYN